MGMMFPPPKVSFLWEPSIDLESHPIVNVKLKDTKK